jgi:hypothetical protein
MSDGAVDYSGTSDSDSESDRSPPGSQLERNRAFWRMISASFMQVSDAHLHRRNRRRSASVTRSSATPRRRASSSSESSSDTADAGAADDGDYELEERSAGNTPRRRFGPFFLPPPEGVECRLGSSIIKTASPKKRTLLPRVMTATEAGRAQAHSAAH